jgi:polar amino acid transport system substrate-binding protein
MVFKLIYFISGLLLVSNSIFAQPVITINTTGNPPLNTPDQTGFMDIVSKEAFNRIGYTLETVKLPAERGLRNSNAGVEDGEMSRIKGLEKLYPNLIRVPEKIMDWEFVVFSDKPINLDKGWSSLSNKNLTYINGWKILEKNIPVSASIIRARSAKHMFVLFDKQRIDYIIYELWGGLLLSKTLNVKKLKLQHPPLVTREMFIYLHKKHKKLVPRLAEALKQMKQDGQYDEIKNNILKPLK